MATSYCSGFSLVNKSHHPHQLLATVSPSQIGNGHFSLLASCDPTCLRLQSSTTSRRTRKPKNRNLTVRNATPEVAAAGDLISSSLSIPGIPGFSIPTDNPWIAGIAGIVVAGPLLVQWLLTVTKEVDMAAQTVEKIADAVEKVAEEVDKAAEEMAEALPEGGFKKVVKFIEEIAEETAEDAQKVEDLMDKVEEINDKLETFLKQEQSKEAEKA